MCDSYSLIPMVRAKRCGGGLWLQPVNMSGYSKTRIVTTNRAERTVTYKLTFGLIVLAVLPAGSTNDDDERVATD